MCGIVGYIGPRQAWEFLIGGLRRLEYRGYDSAGLAGVTPETGLTIVKTSGRIERLESRLADSPVISRNGIGHTRWATHGAPNDLNSHPHFGGDEVLAVVHNGVIENFQPLRKRLEGEGYRFQSDTDTEVIAHLIDSYLEQQPPVADMAASGYGPLVTAVESALAQLQGTFGLAIIFRDWPDVLIAARRGSPLIVGVGSGEHFVASDASPLVGYTDKIVYLADHELAVLTADTLRVIHRDQGHVSHNVEVLDIEVADVDLGHYEHYMLKEIFEQPESIRNTIRGRLDRDAATARFGGLTLTPQQLRRIERFLMTACGTSWHAALVGEYQIEALARLPVEVEYASVASTKAFTSQCTVLAMLALYFGRLHHLSFHAGMRIIEELEELPDKVERALQTDDKVRQIAEKYAHCDNFLYLGRQFNFPTALEGALKLKEISYIHAEGYPAAEMKHGPIALVDRHTPSVFLMPQGTVYDKVMSNLQEIKARGGPVIAVVGEGDTAAAELADDVIEVPAVAEFLQPIVTIIPLQLLSYHIAVARGCDVDKPRNLAKSVTVE